MVLPLSFRWVLALALAATTARAQSDEDRTYEIQINGESFLVESNRLVKLQSKERPGVSYEVAVRVAPVQRLRLDSFQFLYPTGTKIDEDRAAGRRSVRLTHELGFTLHLTDFGGPPKEGTVAPALKVLSDAVVESFRELKVANLKISAAEARPFGQTTAQRVIVTYTDGQGFGHTCVVCILTGKEYSGSCVIQYLDADGPDVLPLIKRVLDSIEPVQR